MLYPPSKKSTLSSLDSLSQVVSNAEGAWQEELAGFAPESLFSS